jgi:hypothetical protein
MQPLRKGRVFGYENSVLNLALRLEYVHRNCDRFAKTGAAVRADIRAVVPALSRRASTRTIVRLNYRRRMGRDFPDNPPAHSAAVQLGLFSCF